ncbi:MAG: hypothetical protein KY460_08375 [Actinobacteria bacterium]|nr:hypothetical protein [Actinomycetota bacterium]
MMWRLAGRNAVVAGATLAAVLLTMQLRTTGIQGYEPADVLSILLVAVPTLLQRVRRSTDRPPHSPRDAAPGASGAAVRPQEPPRSAQPPRQPLSDPPEPPRARGTDERMLIIERLVARGGAVLIAVGSYGLIIVLVLLQAWTPTLSALLVFGLAVAGATNDDRTSQRPTSASDGAG